jgi:hypothetical protein
MIHPVYSAMFEQRARQHGRLPAGAKSAFFLGANTMATRPGSERCMEARTDVWTDTWLLRLG